MAATPFNDQTGAASFIAAGSGTTVFTVGAAKCRTIGKLLVTNTDTANPVTLSIYHIPSGGSFSSPDYVIVYQLSVAASNGVQGTEDIRECAGLILEAGDKLVLVAGTASKLKYNCSGVETDV